MIGVKAKDGHAPAVVEKKAPRSGAAALLKVPDDLAAALAAAPEAKARFAKMPRSHRQEYVSWIEEAKRGATRAKRVAEAVKKIAAAG